MRLNKKNIRPVFMKMISELKDPVLFIGLAKTLNISLRADDDQQDFKSFADVFAEIMDTFSDLKFKAQKDLVKLLKEAIAETEEAEKNQTITESTYDADYDEDERNYANDLDKVEDVFSEIEFDEDDYEDPDDFNGDDDDDDEYDEDDEQCL